MMLAPLLIAAAVTANGRVAIGKTPRASAIAAVAAAPGSRPSVVRVDRRGRWATVLLRGAILEGAPATAPILVEQFSFGWQAVDSLNFEERLTNRGFSAALRRALTAGMPPMLRGDARIPVDDSGPAQQIAAVRKISPGPLVPEVHVAPPFALVFWYGAGGGERLYRTKGKRWTFVRGARGVLDAKALHALGVPARLLCRLRPADLRCRRR